MFCRLIMPLEMELCKKQTGKYFLQELWMDMGLTVIREVLIVIRNQVDTYNFRIRLLWEVMGMMNCMILLRRRMGDKSPLVSPVASETTTRCMYAKWILSAPTQLSIRTF